MDDLNFGLALSDSLAARCQPAFASLSDSHQATTTALSEIDQLSLHCLQQGLFPYRSNRAVQPPPAAPPFTWLPPQIRRLFLQSFLVGYRDPTQRPTAARWAQGLGQAESDPMSAPTPALV